LLTVFLTYVLARQWFGRTAATLAAAGLGFSLWHVVASRWSIHSIATPAVALLALICFWRGFQKGSLTWFALAGAFAALGWWTYIGARILPLMLAAIVLGQLWISRDSIRLNLRGLAAATAAGAVVLAPLAVYY